MTFTYTGEWRGPLPQSPRNGMRVEHSESPANAWWATHGVCRWCHHSTQLLSPTPSSVQGYSRLPKTPQASRWHGDKFQIGFSNRTIGQTGSVTYK